MVKRIKSFFDIWEALRKQEPFAQVKEVHGCASEERWEERRRKEERTKGYKKARNCEEER